MCEAGLETRDLRTDSGRPSYLPEGSPSAGSSVQARDASSAAPFLVNTTCYRLDTGQHAGANVSFPSTFPLQGF
jgi:hypothetical protein